jgi:hypothetical protein
MSMLTPAELKALDLLTEASKQFFALPEHHPMDTHEWAMEMHHLQQRIMCRAAIRDDPERYTPLSPSGPEEAR